MFGTERTEMVEEEMTVLCFPHLLVQEFAAAEYISQQNKVSLYSSRYFGKLCVQFPAEKKDTKYFLCAIIGSCPASETFNIPMLHKGCEWTCTKWSPAKCKPHLCCTDTRWIQFFRLHSHNSTWLWCLSFPPIPAYHSHIHYNACNGSWMSADYPH